MSKHKHVGSGRTGRFLHYMSKKIVRPAGYKRIRTSTGAFKSFSRSARGKRFPILSKFRTRSSKNLKTRLNYMNERIAGKTQKIENYAVKLKEAEILTKNKKKDLENIQKTLDPGSKEWEKIASKLEKLDTSLSKKLSKTTLKIEKARRNLTKKLNKYAPKQKKYQALMQKKIYKSQKRLDKGFTKTCRNLKKTGKSIIGCLEAFEICKSKTPGLDLSKMTKCINLESETMGVPSNLKESEITQTMTKLANSHFIRRFKRRRHLREIRRISKHGNSLEQSIKESSATIKYGKKLEDHHMSNSKEAYNKLGQYSKERVIYKNLAKSNPKMTTEELERQTFEQFDKGQIASQLLEKHPDITPAQLAKRTEEIYKIQRGHLNTLEQGVAGTSEKIAFSELRDQSKSMMNIETEIAKKIGTVEKEAASAAVQAQAQPIIINYSPPAVSSAVAETTKAEAKAEAKERAAAAAKAEANAAAAVRAEANAVAAVEAARIDPRKAELHARLDAEYGDLIDKRDTKAFVNAQQKRFEEYTTAVTKDYKTRAGVLNSANQPLARIAEQRSPAPLPPASKVNGVLGGIKTVLTAASAIK